ATRRHSRVTRPPTPSASRPPRRGTGWPNPPPEPLAPCRIPVGCRTPRGRIRRGRGYGRGEKPWRSVDSAGSLGPVIVDRTRVLRTPRLVLRAFVSADLDPLHAIRSREDVNRYLYECPMSREDVAAKLAERIERYSTLAEPGDTLRLAVTLRDADGEPGEVIGDVNLHWHQGEHKQAEVGYVLHPEIGRASCRE